MFPSFLLSLREGLEAALVIGIVLGALRKMNRTDLRSAVWTGAALALGLSLLAAIILDLLGAEFEGTAEQIFEGSAMLLAGGLLTWMIFWMRRQSGSLKHELEASIRRATGNGGQKALFVLAFLAVAREGLELALFLVAARLTSTAVQTALGAAFGLALAGGLGWILFATTHRLSLKDFFQVTNVLLILFAAGLIGLGVGEFNEAGLIPAVIGHVWDLGFVLNDGSPLGALLKALFGYNSAPSLTSVVAYLGYFGLLGLLMKFSFRSVTTTTAAAD
ncbi:MAG TPA: FTR1 family protein [Anaerolineales bacterium]